jgi:hypothetical protein
MSEIKCQKSSYNKRDYYTTAFFSEIKHTVSIFKEEIREMMVLPGMVAHA